MERGSPYQRGRLTELNRLNYVDDDVLFNTIRNGLKNGYSRLARDRNEPEPDEPNEIDVINRIIDFDFDAPSESRPLEDYYSDTLYQRLQLGGKRRKSKRRKSKRRKSKRRKSKKKRKSKRR